MSATKGADGAIVRRTGRPLSFERSAALEQAMLTFWHYGYETTSIADLTAAMRITPPSLYAAFGDKKTLFLEAARLYAGDLGVIARKIDEATTSYEAVRDMLAGAAIAYTATNTPKGCLLASAAASGSASCADVQDEIAQIRRSVISLLRTRIERDIETDVLPQTTDGDALAGLVMALMQGMSVLARDGAGRTTLLAIVDAALRAWPHGMTDPHHVARPIRARDGEGAATSRLGAS